MTPRHFEKQRLALQLMADFGLDPKIWRFKWNRCKRKLGMCYYPFNGKPGRIELSYYFVLTGSDADIEDTIRHEIAHALTGPKVGHGPEWVKMCGLTGARPVTCSKQPSMPKGRWRAQCPSCKKEFDRIRRPKQSTGYHCIACGPIAGGVTWLKV